MQPDNWGSLARIGIFIVSREVVPEAEWWAMRPAGVSIHAARVAAAAPWATWRADRTGVELAPDMVRGSEAFYRCVIEAWRQQPHRNRGHDNEFDIAARNLPVMDVFTG